MNMLIRQFFILFTVLKHAETGKNNYIYCLFKASKRFLFEK